jgi:hypothetical protein
MKSKRSDADDADDADPNTEEIARAVIEERERGLRERNQNAVPTTSVEVDEVNDVEGKRCWKVKTLLIVLFVIGTATTTLSIVLTCPPRPPIMIATDPTTTTSRSSRMADVLGSSFEADFPDTPLQILALYWLANEDPAKLAVDTDPTTLLERYIAVLFYFSTQGDEWSFSSLGWLSENPACFWYGLDCNDQGFLTAMLLGTCLLSSFCLCNKSVRLLTKYVLICPGNRMDFRK